VLTSPDVYGDEFFASIDGVTNALDNVLAREYRVS
jgi:ubiquitin-activating enzyme E1